MHGRQLTTTTVSSTTALVAAINNNAVSKIVLQAGTYEFSSSMCSSSALCINRALTIEAAVPGSVVLDAKGTLATSRRVFFIQSSGVATLIGLNITGGYVGSSPQTTRTSSVMRQTIKHMRVRTCCIGPARTS